MATQDHTKETQKSTQVAESPPLLLDVNQVAQLLGLPASAIRELTRTGSIPSLRLSPRRTRYSLEVILRWANSHSIGVGHGTP